ncbi:MAG: hypothetical protein ACE1ZS_05920 [Candidatus Poribacteria bacterium]
MKQQFSNTTVACLILTITLFLICNNVSAKVPVEQVFTVFDEYISAIIERKINKVEGLWSHKKDIEMTHRFQRIGTLNAAFEWKGVQNVLDGIFFPQDNRLTLKNIVIAVKANQGSATFDYSATLPQWGQRSARSCIRFRHENGAWLIHNHAWYIQDAPPVSPADETQLTERVSSIKAAFDNADIAAIQAIADDNHRYVSADSKVYEGWDASRDALAAAMKLGGLKLDNIVLLLTVDQKTAIGVAKDNDDVIASFRFAKMAGDAWKLTATDLSGKRLAFAVDPLSKHLTSWGHVKHIPVQ